jgi:4-carboxymuconolactone decarboxylase
MEDRAQGFGYEILTVRIISPFLVNGALCFSGFVNAEQMCRDKGRASPFTNSMKNRSIGSVIRVFKHISDNRQGYCYEFGRNEMSDDKYKRGLELLEKVSPRASKRTAESLNDIAPDMVRYGIEFAFGEISSRPGLDMKSREITAMSALAALGTAPNQLKIHIEGALNCGCTRDEVVEVLIQVLVYAGFPAALNGIRLANEVFQEIDGKS